MAVALVPDRAHNAVVRLVRLGVAAMLVLLGCGGDQDSSGLKTAEPAADAQASSSAGADWCDEFADLQDADEVSESDIAAAPPSIRSALELLAEAVPEPSTMQVDAMPRLAEASAVVGAWAHENCGAEHPFCSLILGLRDTVAASALSLTGDDDVEQQDLEKAVMGLRSILVAYAPREMVGHVRVVFDFMDATRRATGVSDDDERAAEASFRALEQWAYEQACHGASDPAEHEP